MSQTGRRTCPLMLGFLLAFLGHAVARDGVVDTLDGHRFEGLIRLESDRVVLVRPDQATVRGVALTNVQSLWLRTPSRHAHDSETSLSAADPSSWISSNIGSGASVGVSYLGGDVIRLAATGTNILGQRDAFHFAHGEMAGDGEISARLIEFVPTANEARTGLMLRDGLDDDARHVMLAWTPRGLVVQWREMPRQETRIEPVGVDGRGPWTWLRLKRSGDQVYAYASREGRQWRLLRRVDVPFRHRLRAGVAVSGSLRSSRNAPIPTATQAMFDHVRSGNLLRYHSHVPQVSLRSGSLTTGEIEFADHRLVRFAGAPSWTAVPLREVARIDYYWIPARWEHWLQGNHQGVLLASGEFVEGSLRELKGGTCVISSVLFGLKRFDVDGEVLSIVLGKPEYPSGAYEVKTWSGAAWRGRLVSMDETGIVLRDRSLGRVSIPFYELKVLSRRRAG